MSQFPRKITDFSRLRKRLAEGATLEVPGLEFQAVHKKVKGRRDHGFTGANDEAVEAFQRDLRLVLGGKRRPEGVLLPSELGDDPMVTVRRMALSLEKDLGDKIDFLDATKGKRVPGLTAEQYSTINQSKQIRYRATGMFKALVDEVSKVDPQAADSIAREMPRLARSYMGSLAHFHQSGVKATGEAMKTYAQTRQAAMEKYRELKAAGKHAEARKARLLMARQEYPATFSMGLNREALQAASQGKFTESLLLTKIAGVAAADKKMGKGAFEPLVLQLERLRDPDIQARYKNRDWKPPRSDEGHLSVKLGAGADSVYVDEDGSIVKERPLKNMDLDTGELEEAVAMDPGNEVARRELRKREVWQEDQASFRRARSPVIRSDRDAELLMGGGVREREAGKIMGKLAQVNEYAKGGRGVSAEILAAKVAGKAAKGDVLGNILLMKMMEDPRVKEAIKAGKRVPRGGQVLEDALSVIGKAGKTKVLPKRLRQILRLLDL